jgi:hypothetical protein
MIGKIDLANRLSLVVEFLRVRVRLSRLRFAVIPRSKLAMCSAFRLWIRLRCTRFRIPSQLIIRRPIRGKAAPVLPAALSSVSGRTPP